MKQRSFELVERGVEIAAVDFGGEGALALCHHANGFCGATWGLLAEALAGRFRLVAIDARGHGDSSKPDPASGAYAWPHFVDDLEAVAERLVEEQGGAPVALGLGNSFGGTVTAFAAARRPELFERVAMLDPVIMPDAEQREKLRASLPPVPEGSPLPPGTNPMAEQARSRRHVWPSRDDVRGRWTGKAMFANWQPAALELYLDHGLRDREDGQVELKCPGAVEGAIFDANQSLDLFDVADELAPPTLIAHAGLGYFPIEVYEALVERFPRGRLARLPADHLMPMHCPPELPALLLDFAG